MISSALEAWRATETPSLARWRLEARWWAAEASCGEDQHIADGQFVLEEHLRGGMPGVKPAVTGVSRKLKCTWL